MEVAFPLAQSQTALMVGIVRAAAEVGPGELHEWAIAHWTFRGPDDLEGHAYAAPSHPLLAKAREERTPESSATA